MSSLATLTPGGPTPVGSAARRPRVSGVWWLSPAGVALLVLPVTLGLAVLYTPADYESYFGTPKGLTTRTAGLFAAGALVMVLGSLVAQTGRRATARPGSWPWLTPRETDRLERAATPLFRLTMLGYLSFVAVGLRNGITPADVLEALITQDVGSGRLKRTIGTVPGLTTLTQVGVAYTVVATLLITQGRGRGQRVRLVVLALSTLLRAFLFTERLALVELAVPATALLVVSLAQRAGSSGRLLVRLAPLPLVALLVLGFAASEYSRSYTFYKDRTDDSLLVFSTKRLTGYYATSYNNGALLLAHDRYPGRVPYSTIEALWTAPLVEQVDAYRLLSGHDHGEDVERVFALYGNPEFNNPGGLSTPFQDLGVTGGLLAWGAIGVALGAGYRGFVGGSRVALLLYPMAVTGLFEVPRFLYWPQGRVVPAVLALLLVLLALRRVAPGRARPRLTPVPDP